MKLTIHHGTATPFVAVGKNQCRLLDFAFKYPTWHSYRRDRATLAAIKALEARKVLIVTDLQFKINM